VTKAAVLVTVLETTPRVLGERRLRTLRDLAAHAAAPATAHEACMTAAQALAGNAADLPFALLYLHDATGTEARVAGTVGLEAGTPLTPPLVDLMVDAGATAPWPLERVARTGRAAVVTGLDTRDAPPLGPDATPSPHTALVVPIRLAGQDGLSGLLVAGINPQRALDDAYRGFIDLVAQQIARAVATARTSEDARQRVRERTALLRLTEEGRAQAEAAVQVRNEVLTVAAHDLRAPLANVVGRMQRVQQRLARGHAVDPVWIAAQAQSVVDTVQRMLVTIADLSDVVQVRLGGTLDLDRQPVDLSALTQAVAGEAEAEAFRGRCAKGRAGW